MKKLIFIFALLVSLIGMKAQASNDLIIHGFITEAGTGLPIANQTVIAYATSDSSNLNGIAVTDPTGWYSLTIVNGSATGMNQIYLIKTLNCNGTFLTEDLGNNQGTIDEVTRNFEICNAETYPCTPNFGIYTLNDGVYMVPSLPYNPDNFYSWTSSNGLNSGEYSFFIPNSELGNYVVCLQVSGAFCQDYFCDTIVVNTNDSICDAQFYFTVYSEGYTLQPIAPISNSLTYTWTFPGGPVYDGYSLLMPGGPGLGNIEVCLLVSGANCTAYNCDTINPSSPPSDSLCAPNFVTSVITNNPLAVNFINTSVPGNSATYLWDFGDGVTLGALNAEHTYTQPGLYTICLTIFGNGCTNTYCRVVSVTGGDVQCDASFTYANDGATLYLNSNYPNVSDYVHEWIINGSTLISNEANPVFPVLLAGAQSFELCHFVTNQNGCMDQFCSVIILDTVNNNPNCQAYFTYFNSQNNPNTIGFQHQSLMDPNTEYTASWDFGDGTTGDNLGNTDHTYAQSGYYVVCLTITSADCQNTYCAYVYAGEATNPLCDAGFYYYQLTTQPPYLVQFVSNSGFENLNFHSWTFGDGQVSTEANPIMTFNQLGSLNVFHAVFSLENACADSVSLDIEIYDGGATSNCSANFGYQQEGTLPTSIAFYPYNLNTIGYSYSWSFGDGATSTDSNPTHNYATTGYYEVCLTVSLPNDSCTDTYCTYVYVYDQNANLYIYGQVFAGANYADEGTVYLVQQDTTSGAMTIAAETPITGGTYYFSNISPGTYFVRASLSETSLYYSNYVPTYFGSQYYWELAEPIELNINTISNAGYNIALIYSTNPGGPGTVDGGIDDGPFKISADAANPIANATVVVTNLSNVPQRWTKTDASGNFSLGNLAYGTYRLMADVAGMQCVPIEFTLSPETPTVDITLMMGTELTGIADYTQAEINGEIFPNPSSDIAQLKLNLQESKQLSFTLTTITGQTVWSQNQTITPGAQTITIPVNELSGGVYLLSLRDAQSKLMGVRRLVIAR